MTPALRAVLFGRRNRGFFLDGDEGGATLEWSLSDLYQDVARAVPVTAEGDPIGSARLRHPRGDIYFVQATAGVRPTLARLASGRYAIRFNGTNQYMTLVGSAASMRWLHDGTGCTVLMGGDFTAPTFLLGSHASSTSAGHYLRVTEASVGVPETRRVVFRANNGSAAVVSATETAFGDQGSATLASVYGAVYQTQDGADAYSLSDALVLGGGGAETATPSAGDAVADLRLMGGYGSLYSAGDLTGIALISRVLSQSERLSAKHRLTTDTTRPRYVAGIGDSHTFNGSFGQFYKDFYPTLLETSLGDGTASRNFGISGNTTANIVARLGTVAAAGVPYVAVIYAGTNDSSGASTVQASPAATASTFAVGSGVGVRYGVGATITVGSDTATVSAVSGDNISVSEPLTSGIPAAGTAVTIDTTENLVIAANYVKALGCTKVLIAGQHYLNFTTNGDTTVSERADLATVRGLQSAAATEAEVVYVDLYDFMRDLIVATTYAQGDDTAWHVAVGDSHLNNTGEQILANAFYAAMQAQGWA
jgi:lysophospholipase L1-like esterase